MKLQSKPEQRERMNKRLARLEGQIRGIQRLVEEEAECELVLQQTAAARKALDRAFFEMLACMIEGGVLSGADTNTNAKTAKLMGEVRDLMTRYA
jgi:DNA-binding FrmR family transcriptional regulator